MCAFFRLCEHVSVRRGNPSLYPSSSYLPMKHPTASVSNDIPNRRKSLAQLKRLNLRQEAEEGLEEIEQMKEDIVAMTITGKGKTIAGFALMILLNLVCFYLIISIALLAPESEQVSWNNFIYRLFVIDQLLLPLGRCAIFFALFKYAEQANPNSKMRGRIMKVLDSQSIAEIEVRLL
eukprot:TRINITY_DN13059_c0_g1_i1.p1 TRINITY_DN13059_c0_g1~~TRINITY_DN13059_c0_g1_i1.p1  ORF type:complete len:178 (-),score=37.46 TRINITY_DN13059_c0_g1_i1:104-637(-)